MDRSICATSKGEAVLRSLSSGRLRREFERGLSLPKKSSKAPNVVESIDSGYERILLDGLVQLKKITLRYNSSDSIYDKSRIEEFLEESARESLDKELNKLLSHLQRLKGDKHTNQMTALKQMFTTISNELNGIVFTDERRRIQHITSDIKFHRENARFESTVLTTELAVKQQQINTLTENAALLQEKYDALLLHSNHLERELNKNSQEQLETHQRIVELRMQGLDFKSEVNRRCLKVLRSVQSRMGFVPSAVQKQVLLLNVLKV